MTTATSEFELVEISHRKFDVVRVRDGAVIGHVSHTCAGHLDPGWFYKAKWSSRISRTRSATPIEALTKFGFRSVSYASTATP